MKKVLMFISVMSLMLFGSVSLFGADELRVATGAKGKGYSKFFGELNQVCGKDVTLIEVESKGSLDNVDKLTTNEADIGFVQLDTMYQMQNSDDQVKKLRAVASLHSNMLHIITLTAGVPMTVKNTDKSSFEMWKSDTVQKRFRITKFSQLKGMRVGLVGTSQIMVRKLDSMINFKFQPIDYNTDADAIAALKAGKISAMFTVAAFPHGIVGKFTQNDGLSLVQYDLNPAMPYEISKKSYTKMNAYGVSFLSSRNMLMSRSFSGDKSKTVQKLKQCIAKNLNTFKDDYSPAWSEIESLNTYYNLPQSK